MALPKPNRTSVPFSRPAPHAYFKGESSRLGSFGLGDVPIKPPTNRNAPRRSPGRRRVVVFDICSQNYISALLDNLNVEGFYARSGDDFIALVDQQRPHLALVHISNVGEILRLKAVAAIAGTPIIVMSSILGAEDVMAEAGLLGPIIEIPYGLQEVQRAMDLYGRGPDQTIPEPVPYLLKDIADGEEERQQSESQSGKRRILLWCLNTFYRHFLTRTVKGLQPLRPLRPLFVAEVQEKFLAEMESNPPALVIFFTDYATFLKPISRRLASLGSKILVLSPTKHLLTPSDLREGEWAIPHHILPMPKGQLIKVIEEILDRR